MKNAVKGQRSIFSVELVGAPFPYMARAEKLTFCQGPATQVLQEVIDLHKQPNTLQSVLLQWEKRLELLDVDNTQVHD